jgi:hypothetical protein
MNAIAELDKAMAPKSMVVLIPSTHGEKKALAPYQGRHAGKK